VDLLRRVLVLQAAVWGACGLALAVAPRFVLVTIFDLPPLPDDGFVRVAGTCSFSLALLMVVIARRLDEIWWFAWAFVFAAAGTAIVATFEALLGDASAVLWWLFAGASFAFTAGLLAGLAKTGSERSPI
jgi:hypothetical protein